MRSRFLFFTLMSASLLLAACSITSVPAERETAGSAADVMESSPSPVATAAPTAETPATLEAVDTAAAPEETVGESEELSGSPEATSDVEEVAAPFPTRKPASTYADLEVVTLLPPDAIPSIDNPQFLTAEEADDFYDPDELVMGVSFNGEARAYSAPFLSSHEIVNDTVGGNKIAVTW